MPELPEVQSVINSIKEQTVGCLVEDYVTHDQQPNPFLEKVKGDVLKEIDRHGKYIIFNFEKTGSLVSHLRMTGQWFFSEAIPEDKHFRWGVSLSRDGAFAGFLWFRDIRKFGTLDWAEDLAAYPPLNTLGPDAMQLWHLAAVGHVKKKFANSSKPVKNLLLDQTVIAGPGNIYVSEVLWHLKISPETPAKECVDRVPEICALFIKMFLEAIAEGGCSVSDYLGGKYHEKLKAYGKDGESCPRECGSQVTRIVQSGRSTFFCPTCQSLQGVNHG